MRKVARAAAFLAGIPAVAAVTVVAAPALPALASVGASSHPDIGESAGPGLTVVQTVSLFVLIPLGVVALVYILVFSLSGRGQRYRAGVAWQGPAQWWGAPTADNPEALEALVAAAAPVEGAGGARAHW